MVWPSVGLARMGGASQAAVPWVVRASVRVALCALAGLLVGGGTSGCTPEDPARLGAERFIDQYYVRIDLPAAREEADGFAVAKLEREMELLEGIDAPESGGKPQVNYRFLTERPGHSAGHRGFLYELTITFAGGQVVRRALVTVAEANGAWRAVNFQEID